MKKNAKKLMLPRDRPDCSGFRWSRNPDRPMRNCQRTHSVRNCSAPDKPGQSLGTVRMSAGKPAALPLSAAAELPLSAAAGRPLSAAAGRPLLAAAERPLSAAALSPILSGPAGSAEASSRMLRRHSGPWCWSCRSPSHPDDSRVPACPQKYSHKSSWLPPAAD